MGMPEPSVDMGMLIVLYPSPYPPSSRFKFSFGVSLNIHSFDLFQVVTGKVKADLPAAYQQCDISQENISMMVRLCLTDPTFPAFVESVEKELHKIIEESKT